MTNAIHTVVEEAECCECWNRFLVRRSPDTHQPLVRVAISTEWPCPYCDRLHEFDLSVVGVERLPISEPRRQLANLTRRLFIAKVDAEARERERQRQLRGGGRTRG